MTTARFQQYFAWLLPWEGTAYEHVPGDAGGATKFGIDQRSHPEVNIRRLTQAQAEAIYHEDYWTAVRADMLPAPLDWILMDIAVNNGRGRAVKWLQDILGVRVDGILGPRTMEAVQDIDDVRAVAQVLLTRREAFYRAIVAARPNQKKFLKGWLNRNDSLRAATLGGGA